MGAARPVARRVPHRRCRLSSTRQIGSTLTTAECRLPASSGPVRFNLWLRERTSKATQTTTEHRTRPTGLHGESLSPPHRPGESAFLRRTPQARRRRCCQSTTHRSTRTTSGSVSRCLISCHQFQIRSLVRMRHRLKAPFPPITPLPDAHTDNPNNHQSQTVTRQTDITHTNTLAATGRWWMREKGVFVAVEGFLAVEVGGARDLRGGNERGVGWLVTDC